MTFAIPDHENTHGPPARRGFVTVVVRLARRVSDGVVNARQRRADREIAALIAGSGGRLTDDIERRIIRHLTSSNLTPGG